jgi:hypothetical protein
MGSGGSKPNSSSGGIDKPLNQLLLNSLSEVAYTPNTSQPGRRKAFIVGINYTGTRNQLNGCINDANNIKALLSSWGFSIDYFMTEFESGVNYASKANILTNLTNFINSLVPDDTAFIQYSGHGSLINDTSNDEISGKDSVIVPMDYTSSGFIVDDNIRSILVQARAGVNIFSVFDSCNSGSVCDFRYNLYDTSYRSDPTRKLRTFIESEWIQRQDIIINNRYSETDANIISLSGCKDNQFAYEVSYNGQPGGALSIVLLKILKHFTPNVLIPNLLFDIKAVLNSLQTPSLMTSNAFDVDVTLATFLKI